MSKINIHLINTPIFTDKEYFALVRFLEKVEGPLKFIKSDSANRKRHFDEKMNKLFWEDFFSDCDDFRKSENIPPADFVVLLTGKNNYGDYFSLFDRKKNIFVHTTGWNSFTSAAKIYPVAYEIISNILQSLMKMKLKLEQPLTMTSKWIHQNPIGCINDFCGDKKQIILKLRTADICEKCWKKMKKEGVSVELIDQSLHILELVRKESLLSQGFSKGFTKDLENKEPKVDKYGKISIGDIAISLNETQSTLYRIYINHPMGIENKNLHKYKDELLKIYGTYKEKNESVIENLIRPRTKGKSTLATYKSEINAILKEKLNSLADFYIIKGKPEKEYYIPICQTKELKKRNK